MPAISAPNLVRLRTNGHKTKLYLAIYTPQSVLTAQVSGSFSYGATSITVDNVSTPGTAAPNFTVWVGTTAGGYDLGIARFKSYSSGTLVVGNNNIPWADNAYITVKEEIKPESVIPTVTGGVVYEDGSATYSDQNTKIAPIAQFGPPACAFIDPVLGYAEINFYDQSLVFNSATISSRSWVFPSGTPSTSASAGSVGSPIAVRWSTPGNYYVSLSVTDSNGKTSIGYRPVFVFDATSMPYTNIEIKDLTGSYSDGAWRGSFDIYGDIPTNVVVQNAQVVIFAEDWYGEEKVSIGGNFTYRENIVFSGWVQSGSIIKRPQFGLTTFLGGNIGMIMSNLKSCSFTYTAQTAPAAWHDVLNGDARYILHHELTQHSTITQIVDLTYNLIGGGPYTFRKRDLVESNLLETTNQGLFSPIRARLSTSRQGGIFVDRDPQLLELADRAGVTEVVTLQTSDLALQAIFGEEQQNPVVSLVDLTAYSFNSGDANETNIYSLAPVTPHRSGKVVKKSGVRADSQSQANIYAGLFEGVENGQYRSTSIQLLGNWRTFDIAPQEYVKINVGSSGNVRGIDFSSKRFIVRDSSLSYKKGNISVSCTIEMEAYGYPGKTGNYPTDPPTPPTPPTPPNRPPIVSPPPGVRPPPPGGTPQGKGNLLYVSANNSAGVGTGGIAKCVNAFSGSPTWSVLAGGPSSINGLSGASQNVYAINFDPFSWNGTMFTKMWAFTADGLYLGTSLDSTPSFSKKLDSTAATALIGTTVILSEVWTPDPRTQNLIIATAYEYQGGGANDWDKTWILYSTNNGTSWSANAAVWLRVSRYAGQKLTPQIISSTITTGVYYFVGAFGDQSGIWPSGTGSYSPTISRSTALPTFSNYRLVNAGATWSKAIQPLCLNGGIPYTEDSIIFLYGAAWSTQKGTLKRLNSFQTARITGAPSETEIGGTGMSWGYSYPPSPYFFLVHPFDANTFVGARSGGGHLPYDQDEIWVTKNQGTTWTRRMPTPPNRTAYSCAGPVSVYLVPVSSDIFWTMGHDGAGQTYVAKTTDFGATFYDVAKLGDPNFVDTVLGTGNYATRGFLVDYFKT